VLEPEVGEVVVERQDALVAEDGLARRDVRLGLAGRLAVPAVALRAREGVARVHVLDAGVAEVARLGLGGADAKRRREQDRDDRPGPHAPLPCWRPPFCARAT